MLKIFELLDEKKFRKTIFNVVVTNFFVLSARGMFDKIGSGLTEEF